MPADATLNNLRVGWFQNWSIVRLNLILLLSMISSYATGFDGSMMNGLQSLETWQEFFHYPGPSLLGLLNAIQNVGQLVALPLCAIACDRYGRRATLLGGAFLMLIGVALQGGAQSTGMFIAARGLLGFGLAFNITAAPLLILELAYPSQRAPYQRRGSPSVRSAWPAAGRGECLPYFKPCQAFCNYYCAGASRNPLAGSSPKTGLSKRRISSLSTMPRATLKIPSSPSRWPRFEKHYGSRLKPLSQPTT
ncbi:General substrate transporter [Macrophomina phaseolina MS6]|uniref:General substrate transporter n=1 Tax=Macrophomina phaseolina (strain MS6) TaxID=1126212 RepID=K2SBA9_MACPH|nr:General substrate transporter [Macrophomina phaseolina MS6]